MGFSKNQTEITIDTREIVAGHSDIVAFFTALGITISNANQSFTIIARKSLTAGDQDKILGTVDSDQKLVIQFTEMTGPTTIS